MKKEKSDKIVVVNTKVPESKLKLFKALAVLKYEKNPMQSAWEEALTLFIEKNKHLLKEYNLLLENL